MAMPEKDNFPSVSTVLRMAAGIALIALGLWTVSDAGPQFGSKLAKQGAGWLTVAAGVWAIPFLRRQRRK
jgi:hypothetical protein